MSNYPKPDAATLLEIYRKVALIKPNDERIIKVDDRRQAGDALLQPSRAGGHPGGGVGEPHRRGLYLHHLSRHPRHARQGHAAAGSCGRRSPATSTGTCKGKGGPMHLTTRETGVMVTTGIVGSSHADRQRPCLGRAAARQQARHGRLFRRRRDQHRRLPRIAEPGVGVEAAGDLRLPEQRLWRAHHATRTAPSVEQISDRAAGYGMPGVTVDGNDPDRHVRRGARGGRRAPAPARVRR